MYEEQSVCELIDAFLENSRLLAESLIKARDHLETNDLVFIEENNEKNRATNKTLLSIMNALDNNPALSSLRGAFFDRIQDYAQTLPSHDRKELLFRLDILKEELSIYKQIMQVNRTVVHANLMHTKDLFCALFNNDIINEPSIYKPSGLPGALTISLE